MKKQSKPASRPAGKRKPGARPAVPTNEGGARIPAEAVKERGGPDLETARAKDTGRMGA